MTFPSLLRGLLFIININNKYFYAKYCILKKRLYICSRNLTNKKLKL